MKLAPGIQLFDIASLSGLLAWKRFDKEIISLYTIHITIEFFPVRQHFKVEAEMEERPWLKHYDEGVPDSIDYPPVTLFHFLEEAPQISQHSLHDLQRSRHHL